MTDIYLFVGDHADTLSSGRRVAPGDSVLDIELDLTGGIDKRFADARLLVPRTSEETEQETARRERLLAKADPEAELTEQDNAGDGEADETTSDEAPAPPAPDPPAEQAAEQPAVQNTSKGGRAARTTSKETK